MSYGRERDDFESKTASSGRRAGGVLARARAAGPEPAERGGGRSGGILARASAKPSISGGDGSPKRRGAPRQFSAPRQAARGPGSLGDPMLEEGNRGGDVDFYGAGDRRGGGSQRAMRGAGRRATAFDDDEDYDPFGDKQDSSDPFGTGDGYDKDDFYCNGSLNRAGDSFQEPAEHGLGDSYDSGSGMGIGCHSAACSCCQPGRLTIGSSNGGVGSSGSGRRGENSIAGPKSRFDGDDSDYSDRVGDNRGARPRN